MIFLFIYAGMDCPLDLEKTYKTQEEFLKAYEKMSKAERENIVHIIEGDELKVEPKELEIVKSWKMKKYNAKT